MERHTHNHSEDTTEMLSAYIDNAVNVVERRQAEALIEQCQACAQDVRELRALRALLRDAPKLQPTRSFTLDPASAPQPRWLLFPTLRIATFAAALLLLVVVGVDVLRPTGGTAAFSTQSGGGSAARDTSIQQSRQFSASAAAITAPEIAGADSAAANAPAAAPEPEAVPEAAAASEAAAPAASTAASTAAAPTTKESPAASTALSPTETAATAAVASSAAPDIAAAQGQAPNESEESGLTTSAAGITETADGAAGGAPPALQADQPISPDTLELDRSATPTPDPSSAIAPLRIVEWGLALVVIAFGGATLWAWRQRR